MLAQGSMHRADENAARLSLETSLRIAFCDVPPVLLPNPVFEVLPPPNRPPVVPVLEPNPVLLVDPKPEWTGIVLVVVMMEDEGRRATCSARSRLNKQSAPRHALNLEARWKVLLT